jgi:photosystem I subunit 3
MPHALNLTIQSTRELAMRRLLTLVLILTVWLSIVPAVAAEPANLVPCGESEVFLERMANARDNYYFDKPSEAYSKYLLCGEEGLPHLALSFNRAVDVAIPFAIFLYVAGFIGWSGRTYLQAANQAKSPEQLEIFIDVPLAIQSMVKGLLWPVLALQELLGGNLTVRDNEVPISPR